MEPKPLMLSTLPHLDPHLYLSSNKLLRCNLPRPYYIENPLSLHHLAFDSPTHEISALYPFLPVCLSHTTSQMGSILWTAESSWAQTLTDIQRRVPSSQEKHRTNEILLKGNQSDASANSWPQRKHRQRAGKKETGERKSATPRGDFPLAVSLVVPLQLKPVALFNTACRAGDVKTNRFSFKQVFLSNNPTHAVQKSGILWSERWARLKQKHKRENPYSQSKANCPFTRTLQNNLKNR